MDITDLICTLAYVLMVDGRASIFNHRDRQLVQEDVFNVFEDHKENIKTQTQDHIPIIKNVDVGNSFTNLQDDLPKNNLDSNTHYSDNSPISESILSDFDISNHLDLQENLKKENLEHGEIPGSMFASSTIENVNDSDKDSNNEYGVRLSEKQKALLKGTTTSHPRIYDNTEDTITEPESDDNEYGIRLSEKQKALLKGTTASPPNIYSDTDDTIKEPESDDNEYGIRLSEKQKALLKGTTTSSPHIDSDYDDTNTEPKSDDIEYGIRLSEKQKALLKDTTTSSPHIESDYNDTNTEPKSDDNEYGIRLSEKQKALLKGTTTSPPHINYDTNTEPKSDDNEYGIRLSKKQKALLKGTTTSPPHINFDTNTEPKSDDNEYGIKLSEKQKALLRGSTTSHPHIYGNTNDTITEPESDDNKYGIRQSEKQKALIKGATTSPPHIDSDNDNKIPDSKSDDNDYGIRLSEKQKALLKGATKSPPHIDSDYDDTNTDTKSDDSEYGIGLSEKQKALLKGATASPPSSNSNVDSQIAEPILDSEIVGIEISEKRKSMLKPSTTSKPLSDSVHYSINEKLLPNADTDYLELSEKHKSMLMHSFTTRPTVNADGNDGKSIPKSNADLYDIELSDEQQSMLVSNANTSPKNLEDIDDASKMLPGDFEIVLDSDFDRYIEAVADAGPQELENALHVAPLIEISPHNINLDEETHLGLSDPYFEYNLDSNFDDTDVIDIEEVVVQSNSFENAIPIGPEIVDTPGNIQFDVNLNKNLVAPSTVTILEDIEYDEVLNIGADEDVISENAEVAEMNHYQLENGIPIVPLIEETPNNNNIDHGNEIFSSPNNFENGEDNEYVLSENVIDLGNETKTGNEIFSSQKNIENGENYEDVLGENIYVSETLVSSGVSSQAENSNGNSPEESYFDLEEIPNIPHEDFIFVDEIPDKDTVDKIVRPIPILGSTKGEASSNIVTDQETDDNQVNQQMIECESVIETGSENGFKCGNLMESVTKPNIIDNFETEIELTVEKLQTPIDEINKVLPNINLDSNNYDESFTLDESNNLDVSNNLDELLEGENSIIFEETPENLATKNVYESSGENSLNVPVPEEIEFDDLSVAQFMELMKPPAPPSDQAIILPLDPGAGVPLDPGAGVPLDPGAGVNTIPPVEPTQPTTDAGVPLDPGAGVPLDPGAGVPLDPGAGVNTIPPVELAHPTTDGSEILPPVGPGRSPPHHPMVNIPAVTTGLSAAHGNEECKGKYVRETKIGRCVLPFEYAGKTHCDCIPRMFLKIDLPWSWCPTTVTNGIIEDWDHCTDTYTVKGNKCIFPFVSDGFEYNDCAPGTSQPHHFCATSLRSDGITIDNYEVCAPVEVDTYSASGTKCIFPFMSDGVVYNDCASGTNQPFPFCATSLRSDGITIDTWEVCAPDGTEV